MGFGASRGRNTLKEMRQDVHSSASNSKHKTNYKRLFSRRKRRGRSTKVMLKMNSGFLGKRRLGKRRLRKRKCTEFAKYRMHV